MKNLSLNQNYELVRRAIISYFARNYAEQLGYDIDCFEPVMKFVKNAYQAYFKMLEDTQKGDL